MRCEMLSRYTWNIKKSFVHREISAFHKFSSSLLLLLQVNNFCVFCSALMPFIKRHRFLIAPIPNIQSWGRDPSSTPLSSSHSLTEFCYLFHYYDMVLQVPSTTMCGISATESSKHLCCTTNEWKERRRNSVRYLDKVSLILWCGFMRL